MKPTVEWYIVVVSYPRLIGQLALIMFNYVIIFLIIVFSQELLNMDMETTGTEPYPYSEYTEVWNDILIRLSACFSIWLLSSFFSSYDSHPHFF